jgi:hypothetical protein
VRRGGGKAGRDAGPRPRPAAPEPSSRPSPRPSTCSMRAARRLHPRAPGPSLLRPLPPPPALQRGAALLPHEPHHAERRQLSVVVEGVCLREGARGGAGRGGGWVGSTSGRRVNPLQAALPAPARASQNHAPVLKNAGPVHHPSCRPDAARPRPPPCPSCPPLWALPRRHRSPPPPPGARQEGRVGGGGIRGGRRSTGRIQPPTRRAAGSALARTGGRPQRCWVVTDRVWLEYPVARLPAQAPPGVTLPVAGSLRPASS